MTRASRPIRSGGEWPPEGPGAAKARDAAVRSEPGTFRASPPGATSVAITMFSVTDDLCLRCYVTETSSATVAGMETYSGRVDSKGER